MIFWTFETFQDLILSDLLIQNYVLQQTVRRDDVA